MPSIEPEAKQVEISSQNAEAEGILLLSGWSVKNLESDRRKMFRKIGSQKDREINYCK